MAPLLNSSMAGWMDGWMGDQNEISPPEEKDRNWRKENKDQVEELF